MNAKQILASASAATVALLAMFAVSAQPEAVLNVRQSGGLDLDLEGEALDDLLDDVDETVDEAAEAATEDLDELASDLDLDVSDVDEAAEETVEAAEDAVEDAADVADEALDALDDAAEDAAEAADDAAEDVEEAAEDVGDAADEALDAAADEADEAAAEVEEAEEAVEESVDEAVEEAGEAAEVVEEVEEAVEDVLDVDAADEADEPVVEEDEPVVDEDEPVVEEDVEDLVEEDEPVVEEDVEDLVEEDEPVDDVDVIDEPTDDIEEADNEEVDIDEGDLDLGDLEDDEGEGSPAAVDPQAKHLSEINARELVRRELLVRHGRDCVAQGYNLLSIGSWDHANEKFDEALRFLEPLDMESTHDNIAEARRGKAEAYYRLALDQVEARNYDEALKTCRLARQYLHPKGNELYTEITRLQREPPKVPPPPKVPMWRDKDYVAQRAKIDERMRVAKEYYACGQYTDCRREIELLLHDYPWCEPALNMLRRLSIREHQYFEKERLSTRDGMIRQVTDKWTPHTYAVDFLSGDGGDVKVASGEETEKKGNDFSTETRISQKMDRIVIPEIEFRQANIADVISWLGDASREYDQDDVPAAERGVNFVLDLGDVGGGASAEDTGFGGGLFDQPAEGASASPGGIPLLTIKSHYVTLLATLDLIMDMSGLKYRIQGNVVKIMPKNKADTTLIHRMYNVLPSIGERMVSIGGTGGGSGDAGDPFALEAGKVEATSDWKDFFGRLGVKWPDDSTVEYMPQIGKLVVYNTADNLATLEQVLGALNVTPFQVEIEVRFVEVGQTDLNALGLEWILNDQYEISENKSDASLPPQSRRRLVMESGNVTRGFNFLTQNTRLNVNSGSAVMDNLATFTTVLTNPELSVVLHALANRTNADLLSAPKVVAQTGSQATIKSVVEYIYPTEYEVTWPESDLAGGTVIMSDGNQGSFNFPAVEPQNFQTREVGVILQVTPRVSSDGTRISLDLTPAVVSIPTWKDYGYTYPMDVRSGEGFHLTMEQPFFPVRSLATTVDIYNGSTVVMGGMITEERYSEEDKIPILGDIPILGRLFRYKYDQSEKKNLLIFVSARLVDPAGRTVKGSGTALLGDGAMH